MNYRTAGRVIPKRWVVVMWLLLCLVSQRVDAGTTEKIDGIVHIINGATPSQGVETLQPKELWRAGGADDDEVIFGIVNQAVQDQNKNIYLLDSQLSLVHVFSPEGDVMPSLSREGDGPGEVRFPVDMTFLPDGTLGILQPFPGKVKKLSLGGDPMGQITIGDPTEGGFVMLIDAQSRGEHLLMGGTNMSLSAAAQNITNFLASFDSEANEIVRYEENTYHLNLAAIHMVEKDQYFPHQRHWAIGPDGRVYVASYRDEYKINVYNLDGTIDRVICRDYAAPKRSAKELKRMTDLINAQAANSPIELKMDFADTEPVISTLFVDAKGYLWVANSESGKNQTDGIMRTYDQFDDAGHFIKQIAVSCEGDGTKDGLIFAGEGRMLLITGYVNAQMGALRGAGVAMPATEDDEDPMMVVCYSF
jgi:hypothetical protein